MDVSDALTAHLATSLDFRLRLATVQSWFVHLLPAGEASRDLVDVFNQFAEAMAEHQRVLAWRVEAVGGSPPISAGEVASLSTLTAPAPTDRGDWAAWARHIAGFLDAFTGDLDQTIEAVRAASDEETLDVLDGAPRLPDAIMSGLRTLAGKLDIVPQLAAVDRPPSPALVKAIERGIADLSDFGLRLHAASWPLTGLSMDELLGLIGNTMGHKACHLAHLLASMGIVPDTSVQAVVERSTLLPALAFGKDVVYERLAAMVRLSTPVFRGLRNAAEVAIEERSDTVFEVLEGCLKAVADAAGSLADVVTAASDE